MNEKFASIYSGLGQYHHMSMSLTEAEVPSCNRFQFGRISSYCSDMWEYYKPQSLEALNPTFPKIGTCPSSTVSMADNLSGILELHSSFDLTNTTSKSVPNTPFGEYPTMIWEAPKLCTSDNNNNNSCKNDQRNEEKVDDKTRSLIKKLSKIANYVFGPFFKSAITKNSNFAIKPLEINEQPDIINCNFPVSKSAVSKTNLKNVSNNYKQKMHFASKSHFHPADLEMNPADLEISLMRTNNTESNLKNTEKIATSINEMMDMISDDNYIPMLQNNVAKHQKRKVEICSLDDNVVYTSRKLTKELLKCSKTEKPDYEPSSAKTPQGNFFKGDSSAKIDLFKGSHKFIKDERAETCPDKTEITPEEVIGSTQNLHENKAIKDVKVPINANNLKQKNVKEIPTTVDVGQLPILDYNYSNSSRTMNENLFSPKKVFGKNEYQYGPSMGKLIERMGTGTPKKVVSEYSSSPIAAIFSPKKDSHEFADSNKLQKTTKPSICMKFGNCGRLPDLEPNKKNWLRQNMAQFAGHHASVIDSTKSFTKLKEIYNLPRTTGHSN